MGVGIIVVGDYLECTYFGCVLDMGANAGAEVVVAYADEAERLAGVVGQLP